MPRPPFDPVAAGRRIAERTRKAQGLPPTVEDEATLRKIVVILEAVEKRRAS